MPDWQFQGSGPADVSAALAGAAGIPTFPTAAAPANDVSLAEVIRYIHATLSGTAAGENGITTFPAAASPGNNVSLAEVIRSIWDATQGTAGIATWPAAAAYGNAVSMAEVLAYIQDSVRSPAGVFIPGLGYNVSKTENVNTATGVDLFTVTGKVLITVWTGEVTNALGAQPTDYKLRVKTSNIDLCAASNIASATVGFIFQMNSDAGDTLINTASDTETADTNGKGIANRIVGKAGGTLTLQSLRTAGDSGDAIVHNLWYLPLEANAAVAAV